MGRTGVTAKPPSQAFEHFAAGSPAQRGSLLGLLDYGFPAT